MFKRTLLLLVALSLLVRIDATGITMPAVEVPALGGKFDKRSLRGFMTNDETATEERGPADAVKKLKTVLSTSKLGQNSRRLNKRELRNERCLLKNFSTMGPTSKPCGRKRSSRTRCSMGCTLPQPICMQYKHLSFMSANLRNSKGYTCYVKGKYRLIEQS
ncbi:hypothetical protein PF005_g12958 [Phytophthora fragariae]|uniref:RxLR effector protein n=1 Tax=Phytophthora fragariae TaxID=53985 RepID=A0A6A3YSH2_9STRA|nr:hypothetical protein PF003_g15797 [Phytophthora fragariae]KAE8935627.1 hypothetical protein PF009_g14430 [Phytophthora fragariae]KAE8971281.1 hypothetical protein PF011_g26090 [Phytophthora fragariae]KAE9074443.1 hypothetical protein PF010_g24672 [Phytophthora fragariae]KAE9080269.1 hypothetical protein PF007_g23114 [Phytophthora fragariae]